MSSFLVKKYTLDDCQFADDSENCRPNEERLIIDKYCITSNTITYGLIKKLSTTSSINYYSCFPYDGSLNGYGILPTWGIVMDPRTMQRYYGFLPYGHSSFFAQKSTENVDSLTFIDVSDKRKVLSPVYSTYFNLQKDHYLRELTDSRMDKEEIDDYENRYMILRGLFFTSFLIYVMIESKYSDIQNMLITSASSKTSIAFAYIIKQSELGNKMKTIGITSKKNLQFVKTKLSAIYDEVYTYGQIESIPSDENECYALVDMAGNRNVINRIHKCFENSLKLSSLVGITHQDGFSIGALQKFENIKPEFFFAPAYFAIASKKYGNKLQSEMMKYWKKFIGFSKDFLVIQRIEGTQQNIIDTFKKVRDGKFTPADGFVVYNKHFTQLSKL